MIDFSNFYQLIAKSPLSHWLETLPAQVAAWQRDALHGKFREWERAVEFLPELTPWRLDLLHSVTAESETPLSEGHQRRIENLLKNLMPWRKGPYSLYGINIDTEWRSDWKWERVLPHLSDLTGRTISRRGLRQRLSHVADDRRRRTSGGRYRSHPAVPVPV